LAALIDQAKFRSDDGLFPSRLHGSDHLSTRHYAGIVKSWGNPPWNWSIKRHRCRPLPQAKQMLPIDSFRPSAACRKSWWTSKRCPPYRAPDIA